MFKQLPFLFLALFIVSCKSKVETFKPERSSITESVYASGVIKSKNQYQVFPSVNGIIDTVLVSEGDSVKGRNTYSYHLRKNSETEQGDCAA
jgi:HlyD family secretion protein